MQGKFGSALEHYKLYISYRDSINNEANTRKTVKQQMQYDFDKKDALAKSEQEKKDAVAMEELQTQKVIRNGFVGGFAIMLLFAGVFFTQRNKINKGKKRSDELLLNILPSEVAEELKEKGAAEAKQFDEVTVMFTDFKNFTQISEKLSPSELVAEIDTCFKAFDNIITRHNIEKIKTIGDSYMCAGGLPVINTTNAKDVVKAALEIQQFMREHLLQRQRDGKEVFEMRVGIHTGQVVAGIVGVKKFAYDIWGDTVNIASRMESSGEAGKVNISGTTFNLVKDAFHCVHRGKIEAKNKGVIDMYYVEDVL
jgi:class 3 adenylate cyclase